VSTVQPVRAALVALWTASLPIAAGGVRLGRRVTLSPGERLSVGNARGASEPITLGPTRQMEERYDVTCTLSVTQQGTVDQQGAVEDRLWTLYNAAELAVRSVSGENLAAAGVLLAYVAGNFEFTEAQASDTNGPLSASIEFNVRVQARFRLP
jgi:hypothetical protein